MVHERWSQLRQAELAGDAQRHSVGAYVDVLIVDRHSTDSFAGDLTELTIACSMTSSHAATTHACASSVSLTGYATRGPKPAPTCFGS